MTDPLEEALAALRDTAEESAEETATSEATLERIRRSLAASDGASARALEAALTPLADVEVLYDGDRLLDLAVASLREPEDSDNDGAETLERIRRSLGASKHGQQAEGLVDVAAAAWREETEPRAEVSRDAGASPATGSRVLATLDARRARARWALAAAAALALVVLPPTAWAWSTGRLEQWIAGVAAPSTTEQTASRGSEARASSSAPRPRVAAPRVLPAEEVDAPAQEPTVLLASSDEPSSDDRAARDEPEPAARRPASAPRRPRRVVATAEVAPEVQPEAHRADPPVVAAAEPTVAEEPVSPTLEPSAPASAEERELFARAHHVHFGGGAHGAALAAWDDYLRAYPRGRYAPEARYNRALTLVRLGRVEEARRVLARFAAAPAGAYRRDEARALVDALGATGE